MFLLLSSLSVLFRMISCLKDDLNEAYLGLVLSPFLLCFNGHTLQVSCFLGPPPLSLMGLFCHATVPSSPQAAHHTRKRRKSQPHGMPYLLFIPLFPERTDQHPHHLPVRRQAAGQVLMIRCSNGAITAGNPMLLWWYLFARADDSPPPPPPPPPAARPACPTFALQAGSSDGCWNRFWWVFLFLCDTHPSSRTFTTTHRYYNATTYPRLRLWRTYLPRRYAFCHHRPRCHHARHCLRLLPYLHSPALLHRLLVVPSAHDDCRAYCARIAARAHLYRTAHQALTACTARLVT